MAGYMLATSLSHMIEFYNKQVLGEQTINVKGGNNNYTLRGMAPWLISQGQPDLNYNICLRSLGKGVSRRPGFH